MVEFLSKKFIAPFKSKGKASISRKGKARKHETCLQCWRRATFGGMDHENSQQAFRAPNKHIGTARQERVIRSSNDDRR